jgi:SAM-dependent methyltransferase
MYAGDELIKKFIPDDHSRQVSSIFILDKIFNSGIKVNSVLDLGCGKGDSVDYFRKKNPDIKWVGVDIECSPEVSLRKRTDAEFVAFDGINLPFEKESFDLIFSNQVFEHVRYPERLLKEVYRVLNKGGYFVGSVSHLEPYHSLSIWNYTPYGFKILIEESGMELKEIRPGIDVLTLIIRRAFRGHKCFDRYWRKESPLNKLIGFVSFFMHKKHNEINLIKLLFCGQFIFVAQKK